MKTYKDLTISIPEEDQPAFIDALESMLPNGWKRDRESESRLNCLSSSSEFYSFVCDEQRTGSVALLTLVQTSNKDRLYVSNIVPRDVSELSYDQYNQILDDFTDNCIAPANVKFDYLIEKTTENWRIEEHLSDMTYQALKSFSAGANRSTGTAHPMDRERWYEFICLLFQNSDELHSSDLIRWLSEEEGWPDEKATELGIEYEQQVGLLKHYRER